MACWGDNAAGQSAPPGGLFVSLSAGDFHTCSVRENGQAACWGLDEDGQSTPPGGPFVSVSAGGFHTCGLREDGAVACWGLDDHGQSLPPIGTLAAVSSGGLHSCGVQDSGAVTCWPQAAEGPACEYLAAATTRGTLPGLVVAADVLLPEGYRPDHGVHIRYNGSIGAVADFETVRAGNPDAAVLDCRGRAEVARYLERVQRRDRRYSLVHGVAADRQDFAVMREVDVTLVWSPRSNLALYGETVDLEGALESGVRVALSTDWSPSGSYTMREEVTCAQRVAWDARVALSYEELWRMSTVHGAYALGLEDVFGMAKPGQWADLILVRHTGGDPYERVLTATDQEILATWIDGRAVLVSGALGEALGGPDCATLDGVAPRVCGVLDALGLTPEGFQQHIEGVVPVNDVWGQAPCAAR